MSGFGDLGDEVREGFCEVNVAVNAVGDVPI